jgi:hypothetical protein
LNELIAAGKLSIEGRSIVNRRAVDDASNLARTRVERASAGSRGGVESGNSRRKPLKNNDTQKSLLEPDKTRLEKNIPPTPKGDFDAFWQVCPRKIGKDAARRAYAKAVKSADPDLIQSAIVAFAKSQAQTEMQFIPHPATWLNAGRWQDDTSAVQVAAKPAMPSDGEQRVFRGQKQTYSAGIGSWVACYD